MMEQQLRGWKEIAVHFDTSVRTVQRWERRLGLPVHRVGTVVYARPNELDAWRNTAAGREGLSGQHDEPDDEHELPGSGGRSAGPEDRPSAEIGVSTLPAGLAPAARAPGEPAPGAQATPGPTTAVEAHHRRIWRYLALPLIALIATGVAWLATLEPRSVRSDPAAPPAESKGSTTGRASVSFDPLGPFGGVDLGPWPMLHHDPQRTNRSHLRGPASAGTVRVVLTLPGAPAPGSPIPFVIGRDGTIVAGACGFVDGLASDGQRRWRVSLGTPGRFEEPGGIALTPTFVQLTTRDCPDSGDTSPQVGLYRIAGSAVRRDPHPGAPWGPTIAPGMPMITIDEFTMVRAYDHVPRFLWANDLPGYSSVPPAVGLDGAFFILTDGGAFNQPSLWAIEKTGLVRWSATRTQVPSQIAITPAGTVLVPDRGDGLLRAISPGDASVLWTAPVQGQITGATLAVAGNGDIYLRSTTELVALAPHGSVRWRFAPGGDGGLALAPLVDVEGNVYVAFGDRVYSLTPAGKPRWDAAVPRARDLVSAADGVLYVVSGERTLMEIRSAPGSP